MYHQSDQLVSKADFESAQKVLDASDLGLVRTPCILAQRGNTDKGLKWRGGCAGNARKCTGCNINCTTII